MEKIATAYVFFLVLHLSTRSIFIFILHLVQHFTRKSAYVQYLRSMEAFAVLKRKKKTIEKCILCVQFAEISQVICFILGLS